jgi:hypothetical protein
MSDYPIIRGLMSKGGERQEKNEGVKQNILIANKKFQFTKSH